MERVTSVHAQTTVRITKRTLDLLKRIGHKGEIYDGIIRRLFETAFYEDLNREIRQETGKSTYIPLEAL